MTYRAATLLAWSVLGLCIVLIALAILLYFYTPSFRPHPRFVLLSGVPLLVYPTIGAIIVSHRPKNAVGWILCGMGFVFEVLSFGRAYADYTLHAHPDLLLGGEFVRSLSPWTVGPILLLGLALGLLVLVAGYGAGSLLHLALALLHRSSFGRFAGRLLLVRCARHVLDGDAPLGSRALHLREIHAQFLGLLLGRLGSVGFFSPASPSGILSLLGGASSSLLRLARRLPRGVLHPLGCLSDLTGHLPHGTLRLVGNLSHCVLGSSLVSAGDLLCGLPDGLGNLLHGFAQIGDLQVQNVPVGSDLQGD